MNSTKVILNALLVVLSGVSLISCGGGGGGGGGGDGSTITSYLAGPAQGISYVCNPSGLAGVTSSTGSFTCRTGETASLSLVVGSSTINLGSIAVPTISGVSIPVTVLANGLQVADILQALNHGSMAAIDVGGLTMPTAAAAQINAYIASGGTLPSGQGSDDQFLAYIQSQTTGGSPFVNAVTGSGKTFQQNVVLPQLQATLNAIGATNPTLPILNNTTRLSGTILYTGSLTVPGTNGCTDILVTVRGGSILNVTVSGNVQNPGTYQAILSAPAMTATAYFSEYTCTIGNQQYPYPATTLSAPTQSYSGANTITVTPVFGGNNISIPMGLPTGTGYDCSGQDSLSGTDVGLANPMMTLSQTISCAAQGLPPITLTATAKLVGAW